MEGHTSCYGMEKLIYGFWPRGGPPFLPPTPTGTWWQKKRLSHPIWSAQNTTLDSQTVALYILVTWTSWFMIMTGDRWPAPHIIRTVHSDHKWQAQASSFSSKQFDTRLCSELHCYTNSRNDLLYYTRKTEDQLREPHCGKSTYKFTERVRFLRREALKLEEKGARLPW